MSPSVRAAPTYRGRELPKISWCEEFWRGVTRQRKKGPTWSRRGHVKVPRAAYILGDRRLCLTATQRIYAVNVNVNAKAG